MPSLVAAFLLILILDAGAVITFMPNIFWQHAKRMVNHLRH